MKIITLNVNGIRASKKKGVFEYLSATNADVICLQETRIDKSLIHTDFYLPDYHCTYQPAEKKGYSGVAIFSKVIPDEMNLSGWEEVDSEGRFLEFRFGELSVISLYWPSGSSSDDRQDFKMKMLGERFTPFFETIDSRKYIMCGDMNIVHTKKDIKNFNANKNRSGCLPEERAYLDRLFHNLGFIDAFREVNDNEGEYTWWSNRGNAWANNTGWRIDYQILSPNLRGSVKNAYIYKEQRFSDHAPLVVEYDFN